MTICPDCKAKAFTSETRGRVVYELCAHGCADDSEPIAYGSMAWHVEHGVRPGDFA